MQTERNFFDEIKYQFNFGGATIKLIMINVAIFLVIQLLSIFGNAIGGAGGGFLLQLMDGIFTLKSADFYWQPWTFITNIFTHFTFLHLLLNMLFLYFSGRAFEQLFDQKRLVYTYILGGIFGGILEVIGHFVLPNFLGTSTHIVGASGAVMAIFSAIAFHRPSMLVSFFGLFQLRIIWFAIAFIFIDFVQIGMNDGTAHFAHIGGAIFGMWSISNYSTSSNILTIMMRLIDQILNFVKRLFSSQPRMKASKGGATSARDLSDEEYNESVVERQKRIDTILAKIAKSGYESLSKAEKEYLFKQSKK
ncbi:MAG: rhomboid family intramembrane serine protease [Bacteroidota bacterium]